MRSETRGRPATDHSGKGQRGREDYAALRGAHLCTYSSLCRKTASIGSPLCPKHRKLANAANRALAAKRRANNQCQNCATMVVGRVRRWVCSDKRKSYASRQPEYRKDRERGG